MGIKQQGGLGGKGTPRRTASNPQYKPDEPLKPEKGIIDHVKRYFGAIVAAVGGLAVM